MLSNELKARVFISCGQTRGSEEEQIAHKIGERLGRLGYDPYIAVEEQTLRGVKENIFHQLETSEYFIFIDFKREKIDFSEAQVYRGSLFSHQELSIASYLDIQVAAFQEEGVKQEDGLMRFLQGNSIQFKDRHLLPNVIADKIVEYGWNPKWKSQLRIERKPGEYWDMRRLPEDIPARFYHIGVRNLHLRKTAINCYVYLEKVRDLSKKEDIPVETIEFKWEGYTLPNALIRPQSTRHFDAFWIDHKEPNSPRFNLFTDSGRFIPRISGSGIYELTYTVMSENFPTISGTFILHVGNKLEEVTLRQI